MKVSEEILKQLKKEGYGVVGNHSAVKLCRWTKKSIRDEGVCYKEKFYGIKSHKCCQMSCSLFNCQNKCIHCWRDLRYTDSKKIRNPDNPKKIIDDCIKEQKKLLEGFKILPETKHKTVSKANMKKWEEAQEPNQFAISLTGEGTLYPKIGELINELRKRGKTSFLVTNGLYIKKLKDLFDKNQLPTQLYVSVNSSNEEDYDKFHRSLEKDAWKKLNETLGFFPKLKERTRTVFRINLIRDLNMSDRNAKEFAKMIKKYKPDFIEIKGYMSVGFARERLGYDRMPKHKEILEFIKKLEKELKGTGYKLQDFHEPSRAYVLCKNKKDLKIKEV